MLEKSDKSALELVILSGARNSYETKVMNLYKLNYSQDSNLTLLEHGKLDGASASKKRMVLAMRHIDGITNMIVVEIITGQQTLYHV